MWNGRVKDCPAVVRPDLYPRLDAAGGALGGPPGRRRSTRRPTVTAKHHGDRTDEPGWYPADVRDLQAGDVADRAPAS